MAPSFVCANFVLASAKIDTFFYSANFFATFFTLFYNKIYLKKLYCRKSVYYVVVEKLLIFIYF